MNPRHHEVEDIKKNPKHCKYQQISLLLNGCKYKYTTFTFDKSLKGALKNLSGWNARPKKVITPPHPPTPPPPHPNTHTHKEHMVRTSESLLPGKPLQLTQHVAQHVITQDISTSQDIIRPSSGAAPIAKNRLSLPFLGPRPLS